MIFSLLLSLLSFAPALQDAGDCQARASRLLASYPESVFNAPSQEALRQFSFQSKQARACLDASSDTTAFRLLHAELHALIRQDRFREGFRHLRDAIHYFIAPDDSTNLMLRATWYGFFHRHFNQPIESAPYYVQAAQFTPRHDPVLHSKHLLDAAKQFDLGNRPLMAFDLAHEAVTLFESLSPETTVYLLRLARAKLNVAGFADNLPDSIATRLGPLGLRHALESIALFDEFAPQSFDHALALCNAGFLYLRLGEHAKAADFGNRCLSISLRHRYTRNVVAAYRLLGLSHRSMGSLDNANDFFSRALDYVPSLPQEYSRTQGIRAYVEFGATLEKANDVATAETIYRQAIDHLESEFSSFSIAEWTPDPIENWHVPYRRLAHLLLGKGQVKEAFLLLEQSRGLYLLNHRSAMYLASDLSSQALIQLDSLGIQLANIRDSLLVLPSDINTAFLKAEETRLQNEIQALWGFSAPSHTLSIPLLQRHLAQTQQVIVSYLIDDDSSNASSYAFLLSADTLRAIPIAVSSDALSELMGTVHPLLTSSAPSTFSYQPFDLAALHHLYTLLFEPVADFVEPQTPLVIIPDRNLYKLPFAALVTDAWPRFDFADAPYLISRHPISIELSSTLLISPADTRRTFSRAITAFGISSFSGATNTFSTLRTQENVLQDLPYVAPEVTDLEQHFHDVVVYKDEEATEERFFASLGSSNIIHFASHAVLHPTSPLHHALVLRTKSPKARDQEFVYLHRFLQTPVSADLIVLNGCNTASGNLTTADGLLGFHQVFRSLGVHSSLASLWFIDDYSSSALVQHFYAGLAAGQTKDVALQKAMLTFLAETPAHYQNPFYWAAPVLYGDVVPIELSRRFNYRLVIAATALLILALSLLAFVFLRKRSLSSNVH